MIQVFYKKDGEQDFFNLAFSNSLDDNLAIVYTKDWKVVFSTDLYSRNDFKGCIGAVKTNLLERGYKPTKLIVLRNIAPESYFENENVFEEIFPNIIFPEQVV